MRRWPSRDTDPRRPLLRHRHRPHHRPPAQPQALPRQPPLAPGECRPGCAVGPRRPIVFWPTSIPVYRPAVGVPEWNRTFERIGFKCHRRQAAGRRCRLHRSTRATPPVRWFVGSDVGFARHPHHVDPRSGWIIGRRHRDERRLRPRRWRFRVERGQQQPARLKPGAALRQAAPTEPATTPTRAAPRASTSRSTCRRTRRAGHRRAQARGLRSSVVRDTIMHEVGHTLGLTHNFRALDGLAAAAATTRTSPRKNGNHRLGDGLQRLQHRRRRRAAFNNTTIGPYDYWAIVEYALKPIAAGDEKASWRASPAAAAADPLLAFANDPDAGGGPGGESTRWSTSFDLGDDPLALYRKRLQLSRAGSACRSP